MSIQKGFGAVGVLVSIVVVAVIGFGVWYVIDQQDDDMVDGTPVAENFSQEANDNLPFDLSLQNLARLDEGMYEGWVVRGDEKTSFGTFNVSENGVIEGTLGLRGEITPQDGDTIAISIEPGSDSDPEPSATIILAGELSGGSATLAFPVDVSAFSGQYILATPTTSTTDDETSGIWFTISGSDASLDIPVAPEGWIYEGWVVVGGTPITSGQFSDPNEADLFDGFSGPGNAPNKPGEDYVANLPDGFSAPLNLTSGDSLIVVSIEPYQNGVDPTGDGPAQVKPLSATIAGDATDHTPYDLSLSIDSLPSGSVSL